jgi:cathepsin B
LCIAQNGAFQQLLSPEDTMSCCTGFSCGFSEGCNGGQPTAAWSWFTLEGVVSGGDYDDKGKTDTCEPYQFPPCAHHENSSQYPPCPSTEYHTPPCKKSCTNTGYAKTWDSDEHVAKKAYSLRSINDIMTDIYTYGTVTAAFTVYEDFLYYTSGVYVHTWGQEVGGHAIKIIGWGVENNVDYWLCVNSWNDTWGDQGLFKIKKGVNECGIESDVSAGTAN